MCTWVNTCCVTSIWITASLTFLPCILPFAGLHQLRQWGAQHLRISLICPVSQQQSSLEWDGQAAHSYRSFQRLPPTIWIQTLLQWVSNATLWLRTGLFGWFLKYVRFMQRSWVYDLGYFDVSPFQLKTKGRKNCLVLRSLLWWEKMGPHSQMRVMSCMCTR